MKLRGGRREEVGGGGLPSVTMKRGRNLGMRPGEGEEPGVCYYCRIVGQGGEGWPHSQAPGEDPRDAAGEDWG